ncbi:MAG: alpha/beta hydrolase [Gemmatimonadaceae bacterium]
MTGSAVVARLMSVDYRVTLDAEALVTTYAFELSPPARAVADSVTFAPPPPSTPAGVSNRGRTPLWNATPGLFDVLLRSAHARIAMTSAPGSPFAIPLFRFGAASTRDTAVVTFVGRDSARVMLHTDGAPSTELLAQVDSAGCLVHAVVPAEGWTIDAVPSLPASAYGLAPAYGAPAGAPYVVESVAINAGAGVTLAATLTRPVHKGPTPAVVLLHGSTASDRNNGKLPLPGVFWQIADTLARRGIATLRYDQRGIGGSGGTSASATVQVRAADARAALAYLRARSDVDPDRLGVLGLSEGALAAMLVAADASGAISGDPSGRVRAEALVRAVALVSSPGRPGRDLSAYQNRIGAERFLGLRDSALMAVLAAARAEDDSLIRDGHGHEAALLAFDPEVAARHVRAPVLVVHGATDLQVPAGDADRLAAALRTGGNSDVTVRVFPGVDHVLLTDPSGDWRRYIAVPSLVAPAAVRGTIADWFVRQLAQPVSRQNVR